MVARRLHHFVLGRHRWLSLRGSRRRYVCVCTWSGWSGLAPKSLTIIITLHTTVTIVNAMGFLVNGIGYNAVQGGHVCVFGAWIYYYLSRLDQERHALHVSLTDLPLTHPYISSAGWITMVNTYWYKYELFIVHFGQGTEFLLIAGQFRRLNIGNQYHNPLAHLETSKKNQTRMQAAPSSSTRATRAGLTSLSQATPRSSRFGSRGIP